MTSYRITAVKVFEPKDVIGEDFIRESGEPIEKCGFIEEKQVFMVDEMLTVPKGFCPHSWFGIFKELWMLRNGNGYPFLSLKKKDFYFDLVIRIIIESLLNLKFQISTSHIESN